MKEKYILYNAITLNASGVRYNAIALEISIVELRKHKHHFTFDFISLKNKGIKVYKICKENEEDILQALVAFSPSQGVLDCYNMEVSILNKKPVLLYDGLGKSIIALCCKVSLDCGLEGFITFEAKNRLIPYYARFGAKKTFGLRMYINNIDAKKLIDIYF